MGARNYAYQFETSPRKLKPEYDIPKKKKTPKKVNKTTKPKIKSKMLKDKIKAKEIKNAQINFVVVMIVFLGCVLFMMYRNVKINEAFMEVQTLNKVVSNIEKENSQITVQIQNSLNLNNIESIATSTLGMQKLSNKQTVYVALDTKDYVEVSTKQIEKEEEKGFLESVINKICEIF